MLQGLEMQGKVHVWRYILPYPAMLVVHPLFDHAEDWPYWDDAREINEVVNSMARSQRGVLSDYCFSFLMTHSSDILSCSTINPVTPSAQSKAQWLGRKDSASLIVVKSNPKTTCYKSVLLWLLLLCQISSRAQSFIFINLIQVDINQGMNIERFIIKSNIYM